MYEYAERSRFGEAIWFMKPWDVLNPLELSGSGDHAKPNRVAIDHWLSYICGAKPSKLSEPEEALEVFLESAKVSFKEQIGECCKYLDCQALFDYLNQFKYLSLT